MTIWVDAQLPPRTARWISDQFSFESKALRDLGLRDAEDYEIFEAARKSGAVILTKDAVFCTYWRGTGALLKSCD